MQEGNNLLLNVPDESQNQQKFEVRFEILDGQPNVVIRQLTWTEGLGWCRQKTICVPSDCLGDLQRSLIAAKHQMVRHEASTGHFKPARILEFPLNA